MTPRWAFVLRVLLALEFAAALGAWAFSDLPWWLACLVATTSLTVFLLTYPDPHGPGEVSERGPRVTLYDRRGAHEPARRVCRAWCCTLVGCDLPDRGPCHRCGCW